MLVLLWIGFVSHFCVVGGPAERSGLNTGGPPSGLGVKLRQDNLEDISATILSTKSVDLTPWADYFMTIEIGFDYTFLTGTEISKRIRFLPVIGLPNVICDI